ncbi:Suppressor of SWI4 1 [Araneus ventricosus]|uniref:Suppressor of SWI4 1 n=1 Tax=Araneus ventricosus TaxID=182803 RepID=A0A4Y2WJB3_ARAVE|nr:Suppressor of SWI4 1 [Araneus ventricosus]
MSKAVKKLIQSKVPNLSQYQDIGDFLQKSGNLSESEVEMDTPANTVVLSQPISTRGNITSEKSAIRLFEMGPRIKLQLVKIEEGLMSGEVLFHEFIKKTPEEIKAIKAKIKAQKLLKEQRRAQQKKNVEKKKSEASKDNEANEDGNERAEDLEWYRREVGEEPDESILPISRISKKRKAAVEEHKQRKKVKFSDDVNNKKYVKFQNKTQGKFQTKRNTNSKRIVKDRKRK